jgi:hypothetical protein
MLVPVALFAAAGTLAGVAGETAAGLQARHRQRDSTQAFGSVRGLVLDDSGHSTAYANIVVIGTKLSTASDEDGRFRFDNVPAGRRTLKVLATGYEALFDTLDVSPGRRLNVIARLEPNHSLMRRASRWRTCRRDDPACIEFNREQLARVGTRCAVHAGERLQADTVNVGYGLLVVQPGFDVMQRDSFPNALTFWPGGCVITPDDRPFAMVAYCSECRAAQLRFQSQPREASSLR